MDDYLITRLKELSRTQESFRDCQNWPQQELIGELERIAYELARKGNVSEANSLFVLVADLTNASNS